MLDILNIPELGKLEIVEVYEYYDQPVLYSCKNASGHFYLVVAAAEDNEFLTWLCVAVSIERLNLIRTGKIDLHDAFVDSENPIALLVKVPYQEHASIQRDFIESKQVSKDMLPIPGEYLNLELGELIDPTNSEELLSVAYSEKLDLDLLGSKTKVPIDNLGKIFRDLQNVINAIGSVIFQSKGNIEYIKNIVELSLYKVRTGSFKMQIVPTNNMGLFGYTDCGYAIEEFLKLVNARDNQTELRECLGELKSKVARNYTKFLKSLNEYSTDTKFTWTSPKSDQVGIGYLSNVQIQEAIEILQKFQEEAPLKHSITGKLIGGSIRTNKLEIKTPKKAYRGIIVDKDFENTVEVTLGKEYIAEIQELPERSETTGEITKKEYRLLSLQEIQKKIV